MRGGSFQRTLELTARPSATGALAVKVRGYDDEGDGVAVGGAEVIVERRPRDHRRERRRHADACRPAPTSFARASAGWCRPSASG